MMTMTKATKAMNHGPEAGNEEAVHARLQLYLQGDQAKMLETVYV